MRRVEPKVWLAVSGAALVLGKTPAALRKMLERNCSMGADGVVEVLLDGIHARKLGRHWRVALGMGWTE